MAKRGAGNRARAVDRGSRGSRVTSAEVQALTRDTNHALAERMAENRFTDLMASGGVGNDRMALEVLYWLPRDFLDLYQELYMRGLANTDGGTEARGRAQSLTGALGKAKAGTAAGAGKKTYKKYWTIADEDALALKEKIDKRLRALTREVRGTLNELDFYRSRRGTEGEAPVKTRRGEGDERGAGVTGGRVRAEGKGIKCGECQSIIATHWHYCAKCGCPTALK